MIIFHPLQKEDIRLLVDLFNEQYVYDQITEAILIEKIFQEEDFDSDLNFIIKSHNTYAGFASGYVREYNGVQTCWIKLIATIDQKNMGSILIETFNRIEAKLIQKGAKIIRFMDSFPNYFMPGIDPRYTSLITLLTQKGYIRRRDNVNMTADLLNQSFETKRDEFSVGEYFNITIKRATESDQQKIFDFIDNEFPIWKPDIISAFQKKTNPLHIAIMNKKVIAFSSHSCNNVGTGWFGPMGTSESAKGKGLGEILLKRCLKDLKDKGFEKAIIPWVGPIGFYYQKCKAEVSRIFWNYSKNCE
jgi:predicted N-acetyltransferase YhbS